MLPAAVRIFVCTEPQDMRRSFDGLALATTQVLGQDPRSGSLFVFLNKRSTRAKVLWWDTNGYCLLYKRLHQALFVLPSTPSGDSRAVSIDGRALATRTPIQPSLPGVVVGACKVISVRRARLRRIRTDGDLTRVKETFPRVRGGRSASTL